MFLRKKSKNMRVYDYKNDDNNYIMQMTYVCIYKTREAFIQILLFIILLSILYNKLLI